MIFTPLDNLNIFAIIDRVKTENHLYSASFSDGVYAGILKAQNDSHKEHEYKLGSAEYDAWNVGYRHGYYAWLSANAYSHGLKLSDTEKINFFSGTLNPYQEGTDEWCSFVNGINAKKITERVLI